MHLTALLRSYGYVVLFALVGLESLGVPLPGETALLAAAAMAAAGHLDIALVIAVAAAGAIVGDAGGYWVGRKGGIAVVRRYGRLVGLSDARLAAVRRYFERHGAKTVFFGRFVALLRTWAALFAGVGEMPYAQFTLYNATGGIVWAGVVGAVGYFFGKNLARLENEVGDVSWALFAAIVLVLAGVWLWRRRRPAASAAPPDAAGSAPPVPPGPPGPPAPPAHRDETPVP